MVRSTTHMTGKSPRAVDSVAEGPVTLRWIDWTVFENAISADPDAMRSLIGALAAELQEVLWLVAGLGQGNSASRVAAILANLAGNGPAPKPITLGQQELGELTGLTRVTVNKCLAQLEASDALRQHYRKIEICDVGLMEAHTTD